MTDKQPEALKLADELDKTLDFQTRAWRAAKELRRLHEENEQIKRAIRVSGLTLIATKAGMQLTCLGKVEAQGENND